VELGSFAVVFSVFTRALYELSAKSNEKLTSNKIASFNGVQARKKRKDREILETEKELGEC
jgi:NADH/NAD ratio-sensing transcriptional regulator Rex